MDGSSAMGVAGLGGCVCCMLGTTSRWYLQKCQMTCSNAEKQGLQNGLTSYACLSRTVTQTDVTVVLFLARGSFADVTGGGSMSR